MKKEIAPLEIIENRIFLIHNKKVMLDRDLAELYGVETKVLKQAVRRNLKRFPDDFMFILSNDESNNLRSQFVTSSSSKWGGSRYPAMVFTEQGVAMLSSVINSERAIEVNIQIMRAFVKLREMLATHKDLAFKLAAFERKYDDQFKIVFDAIRALMTEDEKPKRKIGFKAGEKKTKYRSKKKVIN